MKTVLIIAAFAPLVGGVVAGLFGRAIGRQGAHLVTIGSVAVSCLLSIYAFSDVNPFAGAEANIYEFSVYTWGVINGLRLEIGFLVDQLTVTMMVVVTFVSLMVHIYTIGYMSDDPGYQRFFSYIALFTFFMLMLCMANNFLQLFFGWEGVGLMSYLLIGFWYERDSAIYANLKAFLVNRVGDFGFVLGIAAVLMYFGTLHYGPVFENAEALRHVTIQVFPGQPWSVLTVVCVLLFIGAMGKSAQVPLHVWLPDSMEGPTPISALIHAATMVTAGIFMVARMSPLFEFSPTALSFVIVIGAITAFFMGLLGLVQNDIKRVVAYSTLSQLGYMTVALGASAYAAGIFHLATHAFFKALLFLGAGSVIIAMHHEQDMRKMGGLRKYMPVTWICVLIGSLALIAAPGFSGFYSKDSIIEAVHFSEIPGSGFAYWSVLLGVFVTALYSFRLYFMVFHGKERMDEHTRQHLHESPLVVTVPLVALAVPSVVIGWPLIGPMLFGDFFGDSIFVRPENDVLAEAGGSYHGVVGLIGHAFKTPPLYLAIAGVAVAWFLYSYRPGLPEKLSQQFKLVYWALVNKYGFDRFNEIVFAGGARLIGKLLWRVGDVTLIDGLMVNGSARTVGWVATIVRHVQTGYLYTYAFAMILGLLGLLFFARCMMG